MRLNRSLIVYSEYLDSERNDLTVMLFCYYTFKLWWPGLAQLQDQVNRLRLLENTMIMITSILNVTNYDYIVK